MMQFTLSVFYRRRKFIGFDNVPEKGAVIFACNHPNSFLDAMIIGAFIKRETHFLARSDVFNSRLKLWILSQFKLMPIYRLQEGAENLGKNQDTFEKCHAIFRKGGAVLMFSEGICVQEMRLRPLKKGTARIAMEYSKDGSPLTIIPTGLNYLKPTEFREDVLISMDTPFNAADFATEYNENQAKGIQSFNKRLQAGLQNAVIDIRDKANEKDIVQLVEVEHNDTGGDLKKMVQTVASLSQRENVDVELLRSYRAALAKYKITDEVVAGKRTSMLLVVPALALFGIAFWVYLIPIGLAVRLVKKKIKLVEFHDSVLIGATVIFTFLYWLIIFFTVGSFFGYLISVIVMLAIILIASLAGESYDVMRSVRAANVFERIDAKEKRELGEMRQQISDLASVGNLVKTHKSHHPVG
jgi:1-acyl-sn-glycerol-3-phosphate acyltransferase